jgi:hypothetical protein
MTSETPPAAPDRVAVAVGHGVAALFLALGLLGALRTSLDTRENLLVFTVSPGTALAWLVIGLVGAGVVTTPPRARAYLSTAGAVLVVWGLAALAAGEPGSGMLVRDPELIALHLIAGGGALAAAAASAAIRRPSTPSDGVPARRP